MSSTEQAASPARNRRFATQVSVEEWLTYVGDCRQLTVYLARKSFKSGWFPVKFLDALFRGYGQVVFANNPLSGLLIAVALAVANPEASLAGLATAVLGLLVSLALKQSRTAVGSGLTVFNPLLIGLVTVSTLPNTYGLQMDPLLWVFMLTAAVLSVYITSAVSSIMHTLGPYPAPCFTVPFNITQLILFVCIIHKLPYSHMIHSPPARHDVNASTFDLSSVADAASRFHIDAPKNQEQLELIERKKNIPEKYTEFIDHEAAWKMLYANLSGHNNQDSFTSFKAGENFTTHLTDNLGFHISVSHNAHDNENHTDATFHQKTTVTPDLKGNYQNKSHVDRNSSMIQYDGKEIPENSRSGILYFPPTSSIRNETYVDSIANSSYNSTNMLSDERLQVTTNSPYSPTVTDDEYRNITNQSLETVYLPDDSSSNGMPSEGNRTNKGYREDSFANISDEDILQGSTNSAHIDVGNQSSDTHFTTEDSSSDKITTEVYPSTKEDESFYFTNPVTPEISQNVTNLPAEVNTSHDTNVDNQDHSVLPAQSESYNATEVESNVDSSTTETYFELPSTTTNLFHVNEDNKSSDMNHSSGDSSRDKIATEVYPSTNADVDFDITNTVSPGISQTASNFSEEVNVSHDANTSIQDHAIPPAQSESIEEGNSPYIETEIGAYLNYSGHDNSGIESKRTLERNRRYIEVENSTLEQENTTLTTPHHDVDWGQVFAGMVLSSSQVYGFCNAPASATIYLAILIFSPTMAAFSVSGALIGTLTGLMFSAPPYADVYEGEWGMQGLLCAAALGGFCYVLTVQSAIAAFLCALLGSLLKHVLSSTYATANLPIMSMPFNLAAILFLYITSVSDEDFVQPEVLTFPEKHWFDFRRQHTAHSHQEKDAQQYPTKEDTAEEGKKLRSEQDVA